MPAAAGKPGVGWRGSRFGRASGPELSGAAGYVIVDLGDLGGSFARARAINDQGQIVVGESLIPANVVTEHATVWNAGSITDLGTLGAHPQPRVRY